jgi:tRNA-splicing endonuclease subunit Sen2
MICLGIFKNNITYIIFLNVKKAFFLCFGLGCLSVSSSTSITKSLSISELWKIFTEYDSEFPFKYAVYHKLRSKGWILKNGIKYGCEYSNLGSFNIENYDFFNKLN